MEAEREKNRIRDNQRRSRARRKEYVLEIEQTLRECRLKGIEASAEVQQAARRVADENHKLRQLLKTLGLGDKQVEQYIQTGKLDSSSRRGPHDPHAGGSVVIGNAVTTLEGLMIPRRPAFLDAQMPLASPSRQASTERILSYDPAADSPVESCGTSSETARQPYGLMPASPTDIGPRQDHAHTGNLRNIDFASHQHTINEDEWANTHRNHPSHVVPLNQQGYEANQVLGYPPPPLLGANPSTGSVPSMYGVPTAAPYTSYHLMPHQQPVFVKSQFGSGTNSHSESASVADTDSSLEDRTALLVGNSNDYPWVPTVPFVGSQHNTHRG